MRYDYLSETGSILQNVFTSHAQRDHAKTWCTSEGKGFSYGEIDRDANRIANALRDEYGVIKGDAVAVCMQNRAQYFVAMFAILRLGAVYVPCSTLYSVDELQYQLQHAEVKAIFTDDQALPTVLQVGFSEDRVIVYGQEPGSPAWSFEGFLEGRANELPSAHERVTEDDVAMLMYTSGTTARPKGVMFSHGNLTTLAQTQVRHLGWSPDDVYLHYLPLFQSNGGLMGVVPAIWSGATLAMIPKFSASNFGRQLFENSATLAPLNSTMIKMILNNPETEFDSTQGARRMMLGLTLTPEEITTFESRFRTRLIPTYGLTESLTAMVFGDPNGLDPAGSAGRVVRGYSLEVCGEGGESLPPGEVGEAVITAHQRHGLALGYFKDPEKTAEAFVDGSLRSGDYVRIDEGGFVWFEGRKKDMIKRSGFNVAPAEIERVIAALPGVSEVAVVGCPDAIRDEAIVAFVVATGTMTAEFVISVCAENLAPYKVPAFVEFLADLPYNFLGKIDRVELRTRALVHSVSSDDRS